LPHRIHSLETVEIRLEGGRHPHEERFGEEIDRHFATRRIAKPQLHDGRTVLGTSWRIEAGRGAITCREVRYATLLHWLATPTPGRPSPDAGGAIHVFASAALVSADGRLLFGQMAAHTANGGRVYFPSGSLEPADFSAGRADLAANMAREVREETGLELASAQAAAGYEVFIGDGLCSIFRRYHSRDCAAELVGRANRHIRSAADSELLHVLALSPGELREEMPGHVRAYSRWLAGKRVHA